LRPSSSPSFSSFSAAVSPTCQSLDRSRLQRRLLTLVYPRTLLLRYSSAGHPASGRACPRPLRATQRQCAYRPRQVQPRRCRFRPRDLQAHTNSLNAT
jgi:hypothetical protein